MNRYELAYKDYEDFAIHDHQEDKYLKEPEEIVNELNNSWENLKEFRNIAKDYNIPFEKLTDAFEESLCDPEKQHNASTNLYDLECDDMMEGTWGYCAADNRHCMDNRMRCKTADDYYYKKDGCHYYQRFVVFKNRHYDEETSKFTYTYSLKDLQGEFKDVPLIDKEDANSLIDFLYQLCDKIDELGGYSECLNHK